MSWEEINPTKQGHNLLKRTFSNSFFGLKFTIYDYHDHDKYHLVVVGLRSPSVRKSAISPPRFADLNILIIIIIIPTIIIIMMIMIIINKL